MYFKLWYVFLIFENVGHTFTYSHYFNRKLSDGV